jgi:hypothetical protein
MPPTVIPPGAKLDDLFYPVSYVAWSGRDWYQAPLYRDDSPSPVAFSLLVTLEVLGQKKSFNYKFAGNTNWPTAVLAIFAAP